MNTVSLLGWHAIAMTTARTERSFTQLRRRLETAGLSRQFVRSALVPSWWSKEHERVESLLPEVEIAVARFLRTPIATVQDPAQALTLPTVNAKLKRPKGRETSELAPSIYAALAVAGAAVRNLRKKEAYEPLPEDPQDWRASILRDYKMVTLRSLLKSLWAHGVPVVHLSNLDGMKKFCGMACCVDGRPVIVLAWGDKSTPKTLSVLAHEAGHIARGHVAVDTPMIDVDDADDETEAEEKQANAYARRLLGEHIAELGDKANPPSATELALAARDKSRELHTDPGLLVHMWCVRTSQYPLERAALRVLDRLNGPGVVHEAMRAYIDFDNASETDSSLLRCAAEPVPES